MLNGDPGKEWYLPAEWWRYWAVQPHSCGTKVPHTAQNLQGSLSCQKVTQVELGGSCWRILPEWYWFYDPGCLVLPPEASYWSQVVVWWHKPLMIIQQCQERRTRRRWTLCGLPNVQNGCDRRQLGLGSVFWFTSHFGSQYRANIGEYVANIGPNIANIEQIWDRYSQYMAINSQYLAIIGPI